jgi:hypothetical protein
MNTANVFDHTWLAPRKAMIRAITLGNVTWVAAAGLAFALWPAVVPASSPAERVAFVGPLVAIPALIGLFMILSCMRLFDTAEAEDPLAGRESRRWKINQRVLQNTVEQAFVFLPALVALALRIDARHLAVLPIAATLWCAGRMLFWLGYHQSPIWRAPGFDWTLNTTFLVMTWLAATLF